MTALANPDLTARLLAAIDEAERWANKAIEENRRLESGEYGVGGRQWSAPMRSAWEELGVGPTGVVRCCAADRDLVDQCRFALRDAEQNGDVQPLKAMSEMRASFVDLVLRKLAEGYGITIDEAS
jgi:ABC-type nitrate/sulfonate/bicarbonate transport system substrate-binding protein